MQTFLPRLAARQVVATPDISDGVCNQHEAAWLVEKLQSLPATTRSVIEALAAGRTLSETASGLGLTYRAAESHLSRARRFVRTWS